jgi:hypothetical protein
VRGILTYIRVYEEVVGFSYTNKQELLEYNIENANFETANYLLGLGARL